MSFFKFSLLSYSASMWVHELPISRMGTVVALLDHVKLVFE